MKIMDFGSVSFYQLNLWLYFLAMPSASGELNEQYGLKCKFGRFGTS
jgi:hypothetical protein